MNRIFMTGATGHAGRPVLEELLRRGYDVAALTRRDVRLPGGRAVLGDLARPATFLRELREADAVVHLASPRGNDRTASLSGDILPMGEMLDAWSKGPFLYGSSQTVYGIPRGPLSESARLHPECWYDEAKVLNEGQLAAAAGREGRGPGISLRMALVFGAGERRRDRQVLPWIVDGCLRGETFVFDSERGLETYGSSFIGPDDFGRATVDALESGASGPFNVAGRYCLWRDLIDLINDLAGTRARYLVRAGAEPGEWECRLPQSVSLLETAAFAARTSFRPQQDIEELVRAFLAREGRLARRVATVWA